MPESRGGIVQSGEPILDIVPDKDELLIDAHVAPTDIDVVHAGLSAQVHLTALSNRRRLPRIEGMVRSVSADGPPPDARCRRRSAAP
jgi:multidrug resistance efflux pump